MKKDLTKPTDTVYILHRRRRGAGMVALLCAVVLLVAAAWECLPVHGERAIYGAVIRLHVIAHSDSEQDQQNKLAVRDAVLSLASEALELCTTREQAAQTLTGLLPDMEQRAREVLEQRGSDHAAVAMLGEESYPTREYEGFCFPAGDYLSLRVVIGKGGGENFWCVLFPPMCLSAATVHAEDAEDALISVGLTPDQYGIITETEKTKYKLRFRILEWLQELW